ncbi:MAG TPA: cbb3-type cytochrome oxidase assembly protein CcoS [Bacteroidetes bacterium]|nr:cbb3-type cytochrome oxidase assembly protein CcoS [Bacteroidota bacterium]
MKNYKLLIIGAGPAGISLAAEARLSGLNSDQILMLDKAEEHSWVIRSLYPEKKLVTANYKGMPAICHGVMCLQDSTKHDTINYLDKAIQKTGVKVKYKQEVLKIEAVGINDEPQFIVTTNNDKFQAKIVVIAIGIFGKPNKPDYPLPRKLKTRIHFDITSFRTTGENILVVGGGDSASEFTQFLVEMGNNVTLSYRRNEFAKMNSFNLESIKELEKCGQVKILYQSNIEKVDISENENPLVFFKEQEYGIDEYDRIVYALGGSTPENFLKSTGIDFAGDVPDVTESGESTTPGLFVGGDLLAGKRGGSISHAFNASRMTMQQICRSYLHCHVSDHFKYEKGIRL